MEWMHGGDWAGYERAYGSQPLDFSANVSPLGTPEGVQRALRDAAGQSARYPDPFCRALRDGLAEKEGVPASRIACGNGAADLIYRIVWAVKPRQILVTAPTFSEYEAAALAAGGRAVRYRLREEDGFRLEVGFLEAIVPGVDLVFLCEPNNPTGITTPRPLLLEIAARCREAGARLVVDECFNGFLDRPDAHTLKPYLPDFPNLLVLKAFTKLYALAGVRLGYVLCGEKEEAEALYRAGPPWNVSSLAQAAGAAALKEDAYVRELRELVGTERPFLSEGLKGLGLAVVPGEANYLLFRSKTALLEPLRERGVLLRGCGNYPGLDGTWYRTAVRGREDNKRLLDTLKEVLR